MSKKIKHITQLSENLINKVKTISKSISVYSKGDFLIKEGEPQQYIYLIEKGDITLVKAGKSNAVEIVHQNAGDIVGVDLVFNNKLSEYSAIVQKNTTLYRVLIEDFKIFLKENNSLSLELIQYISSLIKQIENNPLNSLKC